MDAALQLRGQHPIGGGEFEATVDTRHRTDDNEPPPRPAREPLEQAVRERLTWRPVQQERGRRDGDADRRRQT